MGTVLHLCQFPHQKQEQVPVGIIWNHDQRLLASWSNSTAQVHSLTPLKLPVLIWPERGTGITQSVAAEIQFSTGPSWNVYFLQRSVLVVLTYLFPLLEHARQITKTPQMSRTRNCPAVFSKFSDFYILPFYTPFFLSTSCQETTNQQEAEAETLYQNIFNRSCSRVNCQLS